MKNYTLKSGETVQGTLSPCGTVIHCANNVQIQVSELVDDNQLNLFVEPKAKKSKK